MIGDIEVRDAGRKGKGVFARRGFRRGDFIFRRRHARVVRNTQILSGIGDALSQMFGFTPFV